MADEPTSTPPEAVAPPTGAQSAEIPSAPPDPYADRFNRLERQMAAIAGTLAQTQMNALPPTASTSQDLKDEELWALAQQGNRQAFELYMERIAQRTSGSRIFQYQQQQATENQLRALYTKYPELSNANHPLTQRALQFKAALVQMGSPLTLQTDLDAILRAVADSRELLTPRITSPVSAGSGQMSPQHRQPEPTTPAPSVTPDELALARKMGTKDPAKAKERFWARNAEGRSTVSPTIAATLERS